MKTFIAPLLLIIVLYACESNRPKENTVQDNTKKSENWIMLFDGENTDYLRGFHMDHFPDSGWHINNNELLNDGTGVSLLSREQFSDFILEWEWRLLDEGGNSGVKYFVKEDPEKKGTYAYGLEYQMLDDDNHAWMKEGKMKPNDYHTAGALYEFFAPSADKKLMPIGEFNRSKIVSQGMEVEHWLNGVKVVEYERGGKEFLEMKTKSKFHERPEFGLHKEGHILLQNHSSRVGFKNIKIKRLK